VTSLILTALFSAAILNSLIPGPGMVLLVARAGSGGVMPGLLVTAGLVSAQAIHLGVAGAILAFAIPLSDDLFVGLRLGGAALLVWMAWRTLMREPKARTSAAERCGDYIDGILVGLCNPFNLVFMFGLLPQVLPATEISAPEVVWIGMTVLSASLLPKLVIVGVVNRIAGPTGVTAPWISRAAAVALLAYAAMAVAGSVAV
jgi:threonine/homoserine/homoserine lactone efflux protein